jgi:hypothetical protein
MEINLNWVCCVQVRQVRLSQDAAERWGASTALEHRVRLITGRTHQIRAQLAAVAAPLLGDVLYTCLHDANVLQSVPGNALDESDASQQCGCAAHDQQWHSQDVDTRSMPWWERYRALSKEDGPLGLQAAKLRVLERVDAEPLIDVDAGAPWWQSTDASSVA